MIRFSFRLRDALVFLLIMTLCFGLSMLMQYIFLIPEQVTTTFAFAVFLVSLITEGYFWGITASVVSLLLVNYAFTYPYFEVNFIIPANFYSGFVMAMIAVLTGTLTTKIKQVESMKAETEKEKMRANLLRAISHDLRTPLTTIYGSSAALRENADVLTEEQKDKMLQGIQEDAQWLVRMVENLLSITRIDSGNVQIVTAITAVDELLDTALIKFHKRYPQQNVTLAVPEEPILIAVDCMLMEQVITNLLENAVQHGEGLSEIWLKVIPGNGTVTFEISDDGCGIPQERLGHLFEGYGHPNETKPIDHAKRNAGIGLSLCATIIRAHAGNIEAENNPSGGATFRFTLNTEDMPDE